MNLLTVLIAVSVTMSCLYYWLTASNKHLRVAYWDAVVNGLLLMYVNHQLAQAPGQEGVHIFQVISVWIFFNGVRGLRRLKKLKFEADTAEEDLTGRALELADLVSSSIWGGSRGWERATKEQFEYLKGAARRRMRITGT